MKNKDSIECAFATASWNRVQLLVCAANACPSKLIHIVETRSRPFVVSEHHVAINLAHFRDQFGNTQYGDSRPKVVGFLDHYRFECSVETDGVVAALP